MKYTIRKLGPEDLKQARALFCFFQMDDGDNEITETSDSYLLNLLSKNTFHVLVAVQNEEVIGGLTAYELNMYKEETREIFLYEIGVEPAHRKQGIATRLIDYLIDICKHKGIAEMYVGAMAWNEPAVRLYSATGGNREDVAWFIYNTSMLKPVE